MAVTINTTDTLDYTWANAPGTWATPDAGKPWSAYFQQIVTATAGESLTTADPLGNAFTQTPFLESFATAEARTALIAPAAQEGWSTSDTLLDLMNWVHNATEGFTTGDGTVNALARVLSEAFQTLDAIGNAYSDQQSEGFTTGDAVAPVTTWLRTIAESWANAESRAAAYSDQQSEAFSSAELRASAYSDQQSEAFQTAEAGRSATQWTRAIAEAWNTSEARVMNFAQKLLATLNTRDMLLRNAGGVIGDIEVSQASMSLNDFTNMINGNSPVGFAPFKELIAGDYLYQDAIIWMRLQSQRSSTDTVSITQASLEVDVPDQFDSGSIDIPAGGKRVAFSRTFNVVPYVVAQVVGGSVLAYPDITEIDLTGFTVSCLNMSNTSQSVEGVVSWKASGY